MITVIKKIIIAKKIVQFIFCIKLQFIFTLMKKKNYNIQSDQNLFIYNIYYNKIIYTL